MTRHLILAICMAAASSAAAMTLEVQGTTVFATGPVGNDFGQFQEAFARPGIDTVVFIDSPGGDLWTGLQVGRLIASKGYRTVAAGHCVSACSIMFLGGSERRFADARRPALTYVGIHGAHRTDTGGVDPTLQPQIYAFYKQRMGDRTNSAILNQALYQMDDSGALLRVYENVRNPTAPTYHCRSRSTPRIACTDFKGEDAMRLGVITHTDLVTLALPESLKGAMVALGRTLDVPVDDAAGFVRDIGERQCTGETCRASLSKWLDGVEHKAVASRVGARGFGFSVNRDSPVMAWVGAVSACNHIAGSPVQLCEAEIVDGFDVRGVYRRADEEHRRARSALQLPRDSFYGGEEFGAGVSSAAQYRTRALDDTTPTSLGGIRTIGTQELVRALLSERPPVVIDVAGGNDVVPGSSTLLSGGIASDDGAKDAAFNARYVALLALLAPDRSHPIVFYCNGRSSWRSVNAALRARQAGYSQIAWYRGGLPSWKAASLPTAPIALRAVAF